MDKIMIIMYHYVRNTSKSRYPKIKGIEKNKFRRQVRYIRDNYNIISGAKLIEAVVEDLGLPPQSAVLTFDDGYIDHFTHVFPILDSMGIPGCFFPPAKCVLGCEVLDVNKIHYILASVSEVDTILNRVFRLMEKWGDSFDLRSPEAYREAVSGDHRFDDPEVVLIKRMLQRELPKPLRRRIVDRLFDLYVDVSEEVLAEELYMSMDQIRCLRRHDMYIGSHGYRHDWMNRLDTSQQRSDIDRSVQFLEEVGTPVDQWIMCYPYGAHDQSLRAYLREQGCAVGLTTRADIADLTRDDALTLPRLDTNDVPIPTEGHP